MPSRKPSTTSTGQKQPDDGLQFFTDRNLGSVKLAHQLRGAGLDVSIHDDLYEQTERDPWIFYDRGVNEAVVITSDREFMKLFPHMAAIHLGKTKVIAFTNNNYNSDVRGRAFLKARKRIIAAIRRNKEKAFIAVLSMDGSFRIVDNSPKPSRKLCDQKDWDSYERVCKDAGMLFLVNTDEAASA